MLCSRPLLVIYSMLSNVCTLIVPSSPSFRLMLSVTLLESPSLAPVVTGALSLPSSLSLPLLVITVLCSSRYMEAGYTYYILYKVSSSHWSVNSTWTGTVFSFSVVPRTVTDTQKVKKTRKRQRKKERRKKRRGNKVWQMNALKSQLSHLKNEVKNHTYLIELLDLETALRLLNPVLSTSRRYFSFPGDTYSHSLLLFEYFN